MLRALNLAVLGKGKVHPNPCVGSVVVRKGKIVGEGYHAAFGGPHAEITALRKAGKKALGATLYVTLEPCVHWGKTPPCAPAVIQSGIKQVYIAMQDPNPAVRGKGIKALRKAGLQVKVGLEEEAARLLNKAFITWQTRHRPYVIAKMAMTLDGKIAAASGDSKWISGPQSRRLVHQLRSESDAVMVGRKTVERDNPLLTSHGHGRDPIRVVLDPRLKLHPKFRLFNAKEARIYLLTGSTVSRRRQLSFEHRGVKILRLSLKNGKFKLRNILNTLSKHNVSQLLLEGGGETLWNFLKEKLVDEVYFFIAPKIVGGRNAPTPVGGTGFPSVNASLKLKSFTFSKIDTDILIHGLVR